LLDRGLRLRTRDKSSRSNVRYLAHVKRRSRCEPCRNGRVIIGAALFAAGVAGLALAYLVTQTACSVLTVVLYRYAESETVYGAFPVDLLERGVRGPSSIVRGLVQRIDSDRIRRVRRRVLSDIGEPPGDPDQAP
jgi:hypothetical protein